jgi:hypothetical protein
MGHPSDTCTVAGHERRAQLRTRLQRAVGRRWLARQELDGFDLTITSRGTFDGLAQTQVSIIKDGRATLSWDGRTALVEALHRKHGRHMATLGRGTHGASKLPKPLPVLYSDLDRAITDWRAAA